MHPRSSGQLEHLVAGRWFLNNIRFPNVLNALLYMGFCCLNILEIDLNTLCSIRSSFVFDFMMCNFINAPFHFVEIYLTNLDRKELTVRRLLLISKCSRISSGWILRRDVNSGDDVEHVDLKDLKDWWTISQFLCSWFVDDWEHALVCIFYQANYSKNTWAINRRIQSLRLQAKLYKT